MKIGILWDLDGTLLDTLDDLADSVNYALAQFGYPLRERDEIRRFVGGGARHLIGQAIPEGVEIYPVQECFWNHYCVHCQDKTKPYAGILQTLTQLEKYPMAVVSNKPDGAVKTLCAEHFPGIYARGVSPECPRKPAPDMVKQTMELLEIDSCIYVGDSEVDVLTAKNAGVPCLSVLWGFRSRQEIEEAGGQNFCECVEGLVDMLETMIRHLTME